VQVKVIEIDPQGKVRLSRKDLLAPSEGGQEPPAREAPSRGPRWRPRR